MSWQKGIFCPLTMYISRFGCTIECVVRLPHHHVHLCTAGLLGFALWSIRFAGLYQSAARAVNWTKLDQEAAVEFSTAAYSEQQCHGRSWTHIVGACADVLQSYWLNVSIGTPPQPMQLELDTGSSDLVVLKTGALPCNSPNECPSGTYDPAHSSTYSEISKGTFNISYADTTGFTGDFVSDVVDLGGLKLSAGSVYIGMATDVISGPGHANNGHGLIGVSYQTNSRGYEISNGSAPPTVLSAMVAQGLINRQAYSVGLGSLKAGAGSVVFGGVDSSMYTGDLVAVQVLESPNAHADYTAFRVPLTGVSINDGSGTRMLTSSNFAVPALFDTGTTITELPSSVLVDLMGGLGAVMVSGENLLPCSLNTSSVSISYHFGGDGGPSIQVPVSDVVSPLTEHNATFTNGDEACRLDIGPLNSDDHVILGDSFMRSGYFVFDIANNQIAIAQAASSPASGEVIAIPTGTKIPGCSSTNTFTNAPTANVGQFDQSTIPTQVPTSGGDIVAPSPTFALTGTGVVTQSGGGAPQTTQASSSGATRDQLWIGSALVALLAAFLL